MSLLNRACVHGVKPGRKPMALRRSGAGFIDKGLSFSAWLCGEVTEAVALEKRGDNDIRRGYGGKFAWSGGRTLRPGAKRAKET